MYMFAGAHGFFGRTVTRERLMKAGESEKLSPLHEKVETGSFVDSGFWVRILDKRFFQQLPLARVRMLCQ